MIVPGPSPFAVSPAPTFAASRRGLKFRGLARRQILITLLVALLGGFIAASIEFFLDLRILRQRVDHTVEQSLLLVQESAASAAFNINKEQAAGVAAGLLSDPNIVRVVLRDNFNTTLVEASTNQARKHDDWLLTAWLIAPSERTHALRWNDPPQEIGKLSVSIDPVAAVDDFLALARTKFLLRLAEALLFCLALAVIFYRTVIRPLTTMAHQVDAVDPDTPMASPIPVPARHQNDEIGALAATLNSLLHNFQTSLDERAATQSELAQLNAQLEDRVATRTAELQHTLVQLGIEKEAALQAARSKSDFLATVSHELRTPMNGILGCADLLAMGELDADQKDLLATLRDSGSRLLVLINDILDYVNADNGSLAYQMQPVALIDLLPELHAQFEHAATEKGLRLEFDEISGDIMVNGDSKRIRQALGKLLGNALKFTETGGIRIGIEETGATLRIQIKDTGIGIAADDQKRIFNAFTQVDASSTRRYGGAGLGLAITERLIEGMGGHLGVESTPGKGSCFWIELPRVVGGSA